MNEELRSLPDLFRPKTPQERLRNGLSITLSFTACLVAPMVG